MLLRSPHYLMDAGSSQTDESESLQADVMRFMAILGLCLMVIFALVQSLPSVPVDRETVREQAAQQAALLSEISELRDQVSRLSLATRQSESDLGEAADTTALQEQALELRAQRITELETLLDQSEMQNLQLSEQVSDMTQLLDGQRREAAQQQAQLRQQELEQVQAAQQAASETESITDSHEVASESVVDSSQEEGFRLRFATDTAFFRQVATGRVDVYAKTDSGGFKLAADAQRLLASPLPGRFQEISADSLPASLSSVLSAADSNTSMEMDTGSVQWGVVLSSDVLGAIENAQVGATGGLLVIQEDGAVILER